MYYMVNYRQKINQKSRSGFRIPNKKYSFRDYTADYNIHLNYIKINPLSGLCYSYNLN